MEKRPHARYSQEFKLQAVSVVIDESLSIAETARRRSISATALANWIPRYWQSGEVGTCTPDKTAEISRLRHEVAQLRHGAEQDILKKRQCSLPKSRSEIYHESKVAARKRRRLPW